MAVLFMPLTSLRVAIVCIHAKTCTRILDDWSVERPRQWTRQVNAQMGEKTLVEVRAALTRRRPFGNDAWIQRMGRRLGIESTLRPRGRPRKKVAS